MIQVNNLSGQLGNRLLRLNNALQLSKRTNKNVKLKGRDEITNDIFKYFDFNLGNYPKKDNKNLNVTKLGDLFFGNKHDPKSLIKVKSKYKYKFSNGKTNIGIHLRYYPEKNKPILNNEDILGEYYINSIKYCVENFENCHFIIFGPSSKNQFRWEKSDRQLGAFITKFKFYKRMVKYMEDNNISFDYCITINDNREHYMKDFMQLCDCNVIISSHSTFNICAGFLEKEKKIIHCKKIIEHFVNNNDIFWVKLKNGGNNYYKLWKLI